MNATNNILSKWLCEEPTLGGRIRRAPNEPKDLPEIRHPLCGEHFWVEVHVGTAAEKYSFLCESARKFFTERGWEMSILMLPSGAIFSAVDCTPWKREDIQPWEQVLFIWVRKEYFKIVWIVDDGGPIEQRK
ncbi:MAG: hypothetical protein EXS51_04500 [Candidatus Taylorbacteria bacterium]|nr:hypothetical protein [Candidatus Taylorbacteria bacterium]